MPTRFVFALSAIAALALLVVSGCAPRVEAAAPDGAPTNLVEESTAMPFKDLTPGQPNQTPALPENTPAVTDSLQKKISELAMTNLASRLGGGTDGISVVSVEPVTWPNAALGCPQPDKMYAQGLVPGLRIRLSKAGQEYVYNTDLTGIVVLCQSGEQDTYEVPNHPIQPRDTLGGQIK